MSINNYLWNPAKNECHFLRLRTNRISLNNFWRWRLWWELFAQERKQRLISLFNNKPLLECIVYGTGESLIIATDLRVKGIPQSPTWSRLDSCMFVNDKGDIVAKTQEIERTKPNCYNSIQSIDMLQLTLPDSPQFTIRENNHQDRAGIISPYPWITIADYTGKDFIGAGYCHAPGLISDLIFASNHLQSNLNLLLGIVSYYACESELYRRP